MEANQKIDLLEKHCAALMAAKQPPPPPQHTAADWLNQIKVLTNRINQLEGNTGGSKAGGGKGCGRNGGYRSLGSNSFPKNNSDGTRACRRWTNDEYCWTCGFDMKHDSMTCKYIKDEAAHKKEATATNTMGGSTRSLHLRVWCGWENNSIIEIAPTEDNKNAIRPITHCYSLQNKQYKALAAIVEGTEYIDTVAYSAAAGHFFPNKDNE